MKEAGFLLKIFRQVLKFQVFSDIQTIVHLNILLHESTLYRRLAGSHFILYILRQKVRQK
jgi:hypothetical protein